MKTKKNTLFSKTKKQKRNKNAAIITMLVLRYSLAMLVEYLILTMKLHRNAKK